MPGKNMLELQGKPLIVHTIEAVIESRLFETIVVSSDDADVLRVAGDYGDVQAWQRPAALAGDTATNVEVLLDVIETLGCRSGICGLFQPTSPFRRAEHIVDAYELLNDDTEAVISVSCYSPPIGLRLRLEGNTSGRLLVPPESLLLSGKTRIQEHDNYVHPNGAMYLSRIESLIKYRAFFGGKLAGYLMETLDAVDIDTRADYLLAQSIVDTEYFRC